MKGVCTIILFSSLCAFNLNAQDVTTSGKEEINRIKSNPDTYLYAETTMCSEDEAKELAQDFLYEYVKQWIDDGPAKAEFDSSSLDSLTNYIITMRGPMFRALAYVTKNDVSGLTMLSGTIISETSEASELAETFRNVATIVEYENLPEQKPDIFQELVTNLINVPSKSAAISLFQSRDYSDSCIYGEIDAETNPESVKNSILVVYSRESENIMAVLGPKNPHRTNLITLENDSTSNYPQCGAIWINSK